MKMYFSQTEAKMTPLQVLLSQIMEMAERASEFNHEIKPVDIEPKMGGKCYFVSPHLYLNLQSAENDAEFIAASRTLVPQLVKALEKTYEKMEAYRNGYLTAYETRLEDEEHKANDDAELAEILEGK